MSRGFYAAAVRRPYTQVLRPAEGRQSWWRTSTPSGRTRVGSAIAAQGGRAESAEVDVADAKQVEKLVEQTALRHGRLDYFFNNAAIGVVGELRDLVPEHWRCLADVNLLGVVYGTMVAYTVMVREGYGHIVNVASLAGLMPSPVLTPYSTRKWAVVGFSTSLRVEAAGRLLVWE